MSNQCISGRHNYEHLGTSCDDMDEQVRVMREVALGKMNLTTTEAPLWSRDEAGNDVPAIPDGMSAEGAYYASGFIGTAHDDDAEDA